MLFEQATASGQPLAAEVIIGLEGLEAVPLVVHCVDAGHIGAPEIAPELQIIWRIGEDQVDAVLGQALENLQAIARDDLVEGEKGRGQGEKVGG